MNVYKKMGMIFLIFFCTWVGFSKALDLKKRRNCLECFDRVLLLLRGEIEFEINGLPEIFLRLGKKNLFEFTEILDHIGRRLMQCKNERIGEIWKQEISKKNWKYLKEEDIHLIKAVGDDLGCTDKKMQIAILDLHRKRLQEQIGNARQCEEANKKVYRGMGLIAGLFLAILVW